MDAVQSKGSNLQALHALSTLSPSARSADEPKCLLAKISLSVPCAHAGIRPEAPRRTRREPPVAAGPPPPAPASMALPHRRRRAVLRPLAEVELMVSRGGLSKPTQQHRRVEAPAAGSTALGPDRLSVAGWTASRRALPRAALLVVNRLLCY